MKAIVLFSGGIDSSLCLKKAIDDHGKNEVIAVSFDYGQSHKIELDAAEKIANDWGIERRVINLDFVRQVSDCALVNSESDIEGRSDGTLNAVLHGRNGMFIRIASMIAKTTGATKIYVGINELDAPDFPDCSRQYMDKLTDVLKIDFFEEIEIVTPVSFLSKVEILRELNKLELLDYVLDNSLTCYKGVTGKFGCGSCPSCKIRNNAINEILSL